MPPRVARASVSVAAPKTAKNKSKKRQLDAYSIASHSAPDKLRIRQHRLGESIDDSPRQKRRRLQDDDEDSEGEERIDSARQRQERNVTKRTGTGRKGGLDADDVEYGSDSEGNEWKMGGVGSGASESDLDSDDAFGESDEERFAGFSFQGGSEAKTGKGKGGMHKVQKKKPSAEVDLNEDEEEDDEDEDDFGDEGVDLATMLDDQVDDALGGQDKTGRDFGEESPSEDNESESDQDGSEGSSDDDMEEDVEDDDDERHARLQDFVEALDKKTPKDKARIMGDEDGGLTVDDLLADADLDKATLATFRPKKKSKAPQTLKAPLPKRQQDRIDREIATEKAKEQLDRWRDTVIQNRRSEFLQFPLRNPDEAEPIGKDNFINAQEDQPRTELEQSIQKIMEESGMVSKKDGKNQPDSAEADLLKAEELATNKMPVAEVLARRAELRRARELLFREEVKAKRIAKIKSRSYRRVHRKERERQAEKERKLLDPEGLGVPMDEDEKEVADRRRAAARMGTKHKDSKWAKSLKATDRAVWDESAREGAIEQARRQEDLKKRVAGHDGSEEDMSDDESDDDDEDGVVSFKQLDKLSGGNDPAPEKGIGAMKFMRDADERRRAQNDETVQQMRREMAGEQSEEDEDESIGRAIFGPASAADKKAASNPKRAELEEGDLSEDEDQRERPVQEEASKQPEAKQPRSILKKTDKASGPLAKGTKDRRKREEPAPPAVNATTSEWLSGPTKSKSKANRLARQTDDVAIDTSTAPLISQPNAKPKKATKVKPSTTNTDAANTDGWTAVTHPKEPVDSVSDNEDPILSPAAQKSALYARAFAGDDVAASFALEKAALEESEAPTETTTALPGWGTWTGADLTKRERKTANHALHNPLHKTKLSGVVADERKDKGRERVIVSERQGVQEGAARKGKKYLAPVLPHKFERGEEYERSLRLPIGAEWGTKSVVQRNTRPRVVVRPGKVVEAIERPLV